MDNIQVKAEDRRFHVLIFGAKSLNDFDTEEEYLKNRDWVKAYSVIGFSDDQAYLYDDTNGTVEAENHF